MAMLLITLMMFLQGAAGVSEDDGVCLYDLPQPPCSCGGAGQWTRIAYLDMTDSSQQCPGDWRITDSSASVRACGRSTDVGDTCSPVFFSSGGLSYSRVCGRLNAYQKGTPDAFDPSNIGNGPNPNPGLEGVYIDGVSLTHGAAGSRQHIWTFGVATHEIPRDSIYERFTCPCTIDNWPYEIPSFIGNDYFCATGNVGPDLDTSVIYSELLFDGEGCGEGNRCCELNNPPWFCTMLAQPTTDNLEMRICLDQEGHDEDVLVNYIEIYVM